MGSGRGGSPGHTHHGLPAKRYPDVLFDLPPFDAPWTRELLFECGDWTAYLSNFVNGGDGSAIGPAVARRMNIRCVVAEHTPRYGPGHASTAGCVDAGRRPLTSHVGRPHLAHVARVGTI